MTNQTELLHPHVVAALQKLDLKYEAMACDPNLADTAAFLEAYGFTAEETCNAILAIAKMTPPKYACCVVLANSKVDVNKKVAELLQFKKCSFAPSEITKELTGMEIGGVTPVGLPDGMPIFIDSAVMDNKRVVLGGGNRTSKLLIDPQELLKIPSVQVVEDLARSADGPSAPKGKIS